MESNDPTYTIVARIGALEPENASKIIGYLLLKDWDKGLLMRLAYGPDALLQSFCLAVKSELGLTSNRLSVSTPLNPISRPNDYIYRQPLPQPSPRMLGNQFLESSGRPNPPLSPSGTLDGNPNFRSNPALDGSSLFPSSFGVDGINRSGLPDEQQLSNDLSILKDSSLRNKTGAHLHNRSFSANDPVESDDLGFGGGYRLPQGGLGNEFRPPSGLGNEFGPPSGFGAPSEMDFIRLQQKKMMRMQEAQMAAAQFMAASGSSANNACLESDNLGFGGGYRFPQGGLGNEFGPPSEMDLIRLQQKEMMRRKEAQMATARLMAAYGSSIPHEKDINFLLQQRNSQRQRPVQFGEENPGKHLFTSRRIFIKFQAYGSLSEEDVHNYFSKFGVVENVRILYHFNPVYGFVSFVDAETVQTILARGNFHFIGGFRVLVERKQMRNVTGTDSREITTGPRKFSETQEAKRREGETQLEVERRRVLKLQLTKMENEINLAIESNDHFPPLENSATRKKHLQRVDSKDLNKGQETRLEYILPEKLFDSPQNFDEIHQDESEKEKSIAVDDSGEDEVV